MGDYRARGKWLQRWSRHILKLLRVNVSYIGLPPAKGLLVSNHLSYLDVLLLASAQPTVFVAKSEVRSWPLIGWMTRCAGTLFINRQRKSDVANLTPAFDPVVNQGITLALFPEGTSTRGDKVLPFFSSLLEPAVANQWPVAAAWIGYKLKNGSVSDEVCYWRDMTFFPHFLNFLSKESIQATVVYAEPVQPGIDRKRLARKLHARVTLFACEFGETVPRLHLREQQIFVAPKAAF